MCRALLPPVSERVTLNNVLYCQQRHSTLLDSTLLEGGVFARRNLTARCLQLPQYVQWTNTALAYTVNKSADRYCLVVVEPFINERRQPLCSCFVLMTRFCAAYYSASFECFLARCRFASGLPDWGLRSVKPIYNSQNNSAFT